MRATSATSKTLAKPKPRAARSLAQQRLRLWLRLLRATRSIEAELRERLRLAFGITLPQFDVLAALARAGNGMTMTELSRTLIVSNGNVTGIIDRLAADGLVERRPGASDRRSFVVSLTAKGAAQFEGIARTHQGWVEDLLSGFDAAEAETVIAHLDGLPARIRKEGSKP